MSKLVHIALRVRLTTRARGRGLNVIEAHNEVVTKLGKVAFAKFGASGGQKRADRLIAQIKNGDKTLLVVVVKQDDVFKAFQAPISAVHLGRPTQQLGKLMPAYYETIYENPSLWFELSGPLSATKLGNFLLESNERPLLDVVKDSRTTSMFVVERQKQEAA